MTFLKYSVGVVLFSLFIVAVFTSANKEGGFWDEYNYTPPVSDMDSFNQIDEMNEQAEDLMCDINPESESCPDRRSNPLTDNIIGRMVKGAYGSIITLFKSFSIPKTLIIESLQTIGVEDIFIVAFYTIILLMIGIAGLLLIFNRSDSG